MQFATSYSLRHRYTLYTFRVYSLLLLLPLLLVGAVTALASVVVKAEVG